VPEGPRRDRDARPERGHLHPFRDEADQLDASDDAERDVRHECQPEATVERTATHPLHEHDARRERQGGPLAEQREAEDDERAHVERPPPDRVRALRTDEEEERGEPEERVEEVLPLADPGDGFDVDRMKSPKARHEKGRQRCQADLRGERADEEGVPGVQEHAVRVEEPRCVASDPPLGGVHRVQHRIEAGLATVLPAADERVGPVTRFS
jgi:hypothetical protein